MASELEIEIAMSFKYYGSVVPFQNGFRANYCFRGQKGQKYSKDRETIVKWLDDQNVKIHAILAAEEDTHWRNLIANPKIRQPRGTLNKYYGSVKELDYGSFIARFIFERVSYSYSCSTYEKAKDWLDARNVEISNGLNLTEVERTGMYKELDETA